MKCRVEVDAIGRESSGNVEEEYRVDALIQAFKYVKRVTTAYKHGQMVKVKIYDITNDHNSLVFEFLT